MPLDQVMAKYQAENANPSLKKLKNENCAGRSSSHPSPFLRGRRTRDKEACSSSGAGCSSSSSSWNTNETDVSSSSQQCEITASSSNQKTVETAASSSDADQELDSTTSNGDVSRNAPQVGSSTADSDVVKSSDSEVVKSSEMPDSSEDVNETVSPSKVTNSTSSQNEAEMNGKRSSKNFEAADSSKNPGDDECSSSCTPVENGEAGQQEKISSSGRMRNQALNLFKSLLTERDSETDDDDDDSEENDETFDGQAERYTKFKSCIVHFFTLNLDNIVSI